MWNLRNLTRLENFLQNFKFSSSSNLQMFGIFTQTQHNLKAKTSLTLEWKIKENLSENFMLTFAPLLPKQTCSVVVHPNTPQIHFGRDCLWFGFCWYLSSTFNLIIYSSEFTTENSRKWDRFVTYPQQGLLAVMEIISECFHYVWIYAQYFYANSLWTWMFLSFQPVTQLVSVLSCVDVIQDNLKK